MRLSGGLARILLLCREQPRREQGRPCGFVRLCRQFSLTEMVLEDDQQYSRCKEEQ
jgi:hypothetical protein